MPSLKSDSPANWAWMRLGNAGAAQHFKHGNGISGRNERAKDEALHPRNAATAEQMT